MGRQAARAPVRRRNDPAQYDDLIDQWWNPYGRFAGLRWLADARARLIPPPPRPGVPLLDVACGAGLLAPSLGRRSPGWAHVGVDVSQAALGLARERSGGSLRPLRADALRLPFADASFACVVAGELLEHLPDVDAACAELARVLAPGGTLVIDTIADTWFARIGVVRVAERLPGGPPPRIHDPALLVDPTRLAATLTANGLTVRRITGLRPAVVPYLLWLTRRRQDSYFLSTRYRGGLYQVLATKYR